MYLTRPGDTYEVPLGDFLGDMTDELNGGHIVDWVSAGPKQYAYECQMPNGERKQVVKVRGITLTHTNLKRLNFKTMKRLVLEFLQHRLAGTITFTADQLRRTGTGVQTRTQSKRYRVVYDKCRVLPNTVCVPFGFRG